MERQNNEQASATMINAQQNPEAWALLVMEMDEAREHLAALVDRMGRAGCLEKAVFAVELGHVFAHLNRAWHSRGQDAAVTPEQRVACSDFPTDLRPVG